MPRLLTSVSGRRWRSLALSCNAAARGGRCGSASKKPTDCSYAEIAERRADPHLAERTDVLAMLVRATDEDGRSLTDRELRDQLMTLIVAGHDTTATGLSWALERLTRHPAILEKAVRAADAEDAAGDEYLDAVAKETLRIRPVVFDVGRVLKEPVELAGYQLPAGVMVVPGIGLVHSNSEVYPDAERFDPDRMVGATLSPTTWFPFGGGNRRCLGATFAMVEMRVVLREILRRVELATTTAPGERQRVKHVILVPRGGGRIRVRAARQVPVTTRASRLTTPRNTPGTRAATGTIRDRTGRISLACSTAAVSSRYRRDIRRHRRS